jgi:transmembrane sensor
MLREALTRERLLAMPPGEASAYLALRSADGMTDGEQQLLAEWLASDAQNSAEFERAMRGWRSLDQADGDELLLAMRAHARLAGATRRFTWAGGMAVAAMLVLALTTTLMFALNPSRRPAAAGDTAAAPVAWQVYRAPQHRLREIKLADGSVMTLDAGSVSEVRIAGKERAIRLIDGRAFFDVAKDPNRSFAVAAGDRVVTALGTRFDVDASGRTLRVTLFRGSIAITPPDGAGQRVLLKAGQQFVLQEGVPVVRSLNASGSDGPSWVSGLIELDGTSLAEAVRQVNRYSERQIAIADPAVARIRVSGQFRAGDTDRFAQTLGELYRIRVVHGSNGITLAAAP